MATPAEPFSGTMDWLRTLATYTDLELIGTTLALEAQGYWIDLCDLEPGTALYDGAYVKHGLREHDLMLRVVYLIDATPADECDRRT